MKIVFCTTCKGRAFHLKKTLPKNIQDNPKSTFVVLDYGSKDDLLPFLKSLNCNRLFVYSYRTNGAFDMAHAKNMSQRLGMLHEADLLVNLDADNYTNKGFEDWLESNYDKNAFFGTGWLDWNKRWLRGAYGRIASTPAAFIKTGGYDEQHFSTWSPDDEDYKARLQFLGYKEIHIDHKFLNSIDHEDDLRFSEYPHIGRARKGTHAKLLHERTTGVVNFGNIGTGEVFRPDGSGVHIRPIPTRIFGIGLQRTATTSLHEALKALNYESAHWARWETHAWVRDVWDQVHTMGTSPALERHYAASDLPIPLLFKKLDQVYPGSKFILTVRNELDWLRSMRDHFSYEKNPNKWEWNINPISHTLHQVLYGRTEFDTSVMLTRYLDHTLEVKEYFKNRLHDLLIMDMSKGAGWKELCRFLGNPIPKVPYPKENVTGK